MSDDKLPSLDMGDMDLSGLDDKEFLYIMSEAKNQLTSQAREFSLAGVLAFIATVGRDERGQKLDVAPIHWSWFAHIFYCWNNDTIPVILAPWGHGKSVNIAVMFPVWLLGQNPDIRQKIVCNSDENAVKRVRAIRSILGSRPSERNKDLSSVFPHCRRGTGAWNDHQITVRRSTDAVAADESVEAHGVFGVGIGGRCDFLAFDDLPDRRNSIEQPILRQRVIDTAKGTWQSRLEPDGRQVEIMTRWHEADMAKDRMENPAYCVMVQRISANQGHVEVEVHHAPTDEHPVDSELPLWHAKWNPKALRRRKAEIGEREYSRGFEQRAFAEGELWFPSWPSCGKKLRIDQIEGMDKALMVSSVDPASKSRRGTAVLTVAVTPDGLRVPVDVRLGQWSAPEALRQVDIVDAIFSPEIVMVETNATQDSWVDWAKSDGKLWWPRIQPFVTGRNKADPERGLRTLEIEFANQAWLFPLDEPVDPSTGLRTEEPIGVPLKDHVRVCTCAWCELSRQLRLYPASADTDLLMTAWFCREGIHGKIGSSRAVPSGQSLREGRKGKREGRKAAGEGTSRRGMSRRARKYASEGDYDYADIISVRGRR